MIGNLKELEVLFADFATPAGRGPILPSPGRAADIPVVILGFLRISKEFLSIPKYHGRLAPGARHRRAHFAIGLRGVQVFKIAPMANYRDLSFKSSEIGTLKRGSLQRSSVLPTRAFSESISNVNLSFCT